MQTINSSILIYRAGLRQNDFYFLNSKKNYSSHTIHFNP